MYETKGYEQHVLGILLLQPGAIFMNTLGLHYIPSYTHITGQLKEKKTKKNSRWSGVGCCL